MKTVDAYTYVGPEEIRRAVASHPAGTPLSSREVLEDWLLAHPEAREEGATYTVELRGRMRLAPRRSEHVACAGGEEVLAAGEIRFQGTGTRLSVAEVSNQSTGYCPDTTCWAAVAGALEHAGVVPPPGFTHAVVFRRCSRCGERNLVKEAWFVCVFCDADLPAEWNVAPRREVDFPPSSELMTNNRTEWRVVILHGAHGGPDTNWFPWLHAALSSEGIDVLRPRFPTPQGQSLGAWLRTYDLALESLPPARTVLVGHSLGAAFALRLVERAAGPVDGLFLAAGFLGALGLSDYDGINQSFFATPFDWATLRERTPPACRCWAGDNDPYVPLSRSQEITDRLNVPLEIVPGGGHLNGETGFVTFPRLRDAILAACGRA